MKHEIINANIDLKNLPDYESMSGHIIPSEMAANVALTHVIEERFWYCTDHGAAAYIGLTQARNNYRLYREQMSILKKNLPHMMDRVFRTFVKWDGGKRATPKNMVSFGIAGGNKEIAILDALLKCCVKSLPIQFVPVELSYPLLLYGLRQVQKKFHEEIEAKRLVISAAVTDYNKAKMDNFVGPGYRLITMLGVIMNSDMEKFFESMRGLMNDRTLLLLDVGLIGGRSNEEMCKSYRDIDSKRFIFSPLNLLGDAIRNERNAYVGDEYMEAYELFRKIRFDEEAIKAEVVTTKTLESFIKKHNLPILARDMLRVRGDSSRTVIQTYAPKDGEAYVLGHSTRFREEDFDAHLKRQGFKTVGKWREDGGYNAYYLLSLKGA